MGKFLNFALDVLTGMAKASAKQNSNYNSKDREAIEYAKELQHKRLGDKSHYKRCPSCNMLVDKYRVRCNYCHTLIGK